MMGFFAPWIVHAVVLALHLALPARWVDGYVRGPDGRPLRYRLNGLLVMATTVVGYALLCRFAGLPWDALYTTRWEGALGACVLGLVFTAWIVLPAPPVRGLAADLFLGRLENPQFFGGRVDAKMYLYLTGATLLALNLVSDVAHSLQSASPNPGLALYGLLFGFFVCEYLVFEEVHLYTYDLFAERMGFKLGWGCLVFYPYFYPIGAWAVADRPDPGAPLWAQLLAIAVFFGGWSLARGANLQKYWFKRDPTRPFLGIAPEVLTDGERRLLVSGFWGASRHINYLGEVGMASGLALATGYPDHVGPWLYPLYYVLLLVPRSWDDDRRCAAKYGPLWDTYRQRVKWRIVPGIY